MEAENFGPHGFLVRIRDDEGKVCENVRISDCGHKMGFKKLQFFFLYLSGLNGVDNGRLWFNGVRIPRDNLLDKFGTVNDQVPLFKKQKLIIQKGKYETSIPHSGTRFNTTIDALVGGRITVAAMALSLARLGLTIAIKYGDSRKQFGPPKKPGD